jgi:plasmid stability protein
MAQVIVRHLEDETVRRLKDRARRKGHSLEQELREILAAAARQDMAEFKARAAAIRARYEGTPQTDSTLLLREDRDRSTWSSMPASRSSGSPPKCCHARRSGSWMVVTSCSRRTSSWSSAATSSGRKSGSAN